MYMVNTNRDGNNLIIEQKKYNGQNCFRNSPQVGLPALEATSGKFPSNGSLLSQVRIGHIKGREESLLNLGLFERDKSKWEIGLSYLILSQRPSFL